MKIIAIYLCLIAVIYAFIIIYKSNNEWKSFRENNIQQPPMFPSLSKKLTKTSDVKKTSEIYQKRLNDFAHFRYIHRY